MTYFWHTLCYCSGFIIVHALFSWSFKFLVVKPHSFMTHIWHQLDYVLSFLSALNWSKNIFWEPGQLQPDTSGITSFAMAFSSWLLQVNMAWAESIPSVVSETVSPSSHCLLREELSGLSRHFLNFLASQSRMHSSQMLLWSRKSDPYVRSERVFASRARESTHLERRKREKKTEQKKKDWSKILCTCNAGSVLDGHIICF